MIRCEGLIKTYGGLKALNEVRLDLPDSGVVALVGPNGAGKSTLFNVLTGFCVPDCGRCFVGDMEITGWPPHKIAQIGISRTFQRTRLMFHESVIENILLANTPIQNERLVHAFFRLDAREEKYTISELICVLNRCGLAPYANSKAEELSYGQKKILSLACCWSRRTRIVLLDEPLAGLHPLMKMHVCELLSDLRSEGKLVVIIEHDMTALKRIANSFVLMDNGRIASIQRNTALPDH